MQLVKVSHIVFTTFSLLLATKFVCAQQWECLGPPGGRVRVLEINPQVPSIVFAGTDDGLIFRSTDGGNTTKFVNHSSGYLFSVTDIAINPENPNIMYSSQYRSTDGGSVWERMTGGGATMRLTTWIQGWSMPRQVRIF